MSRRTLATENSYVLGHLDPEIERLQVQARVIAPVTGRLVNECGIAAGMRVLDIGCGTGDVSMLLADAVGPSGKVVGIDREERAIEVSRSRAERAGYRNIEFVQTTDEELPSDRSFDAAVGRYVLIHQTDPAAMVRRATMAVRPCGILAFHEPVLHRSFKGAIWPSIELGEIIADYPLWTSFFRASFPSYDVGGRLVACFDEAGLPTPNLIWEAIAGDYTSPLVHLYELNIRTTMPILARLGFPRPDIGDLETLAQRLAAQMRAVKAQATSLPQSCGWARRP
jgi:2-polyprenyl-3-methyl-5-hydroxy-6-metoxy-1,4-benzoquinol methylase